MENGRWVPIVMVLWTTVAISTSRKRLGAVKRSGGFQAYCMDALYAIVVIFAVVY